MQKWEYRIISARFTSKSVVHITDGINDMGEMDREVALPLYGSKALGEQGWEMFAVDGDSYFYKRPIE